MSLKMTEADLPGGALSTEKMSLNLSNDKGVVTLKLLKNGQSETEITLDAAELDLVLTKLSEARALMREPVPAQPLQEPGTRELVVLDPMWQTDPSFHGSLGGIILRLRHLGFGWLAFLLPHHEAFALGRWLCDYERVRVQTTPSNFPGAEDGNESTTADGAHG